MFDNAMCLWNAFYFICLTLFVDDKKREKKEEIKIKIWRRKRRLKEIKIKIKRRKRRLKENKIKI